MIEILYSVLGLGGVAVLIWAVRSIKRWGAADFKKEQSENSLKGTRNAKKTHDRVERDSDYRAGVRKRNR